MIISIATASWLPISILLGGAVPQMWHGLAEEFAALSRVFPSIFGSVMVVEVRK